MRALLISTYELGRQPFGLASPAAWLRREGWVVECVDTAKDPLEDASLASADLIGVHLPMHTATRLAGPLIQRARRLNPAARATRNFPIASGRETIYTLVIRDPRVPAGEE